MTAKKRKIFDKKISLLRGAVNIRFLIYRAGPYEDIIVSVETETHFREPEFRKPAAAIVRGC